MASSPRLPLAPWPQSEPGPGPAEGRRGREGRGAQAGAPGRPLPLVVPGVPPALRPTPRSPPGPSTLIRFHPRPRALWLRGSLDVGRALRSVQLGPSTVHPQSLTSWPSPISFLAVSTIFSFWHLVLALLLVTDLWEGGLFGLLRFVVVAFKHLFAPVSSLAFRGPHSLNLFWSPASLLSVQPLLTTEPISVL